LQLDIAANTAITWQRGTQNVDKKTEQSSYQQARKKTLPTGQVH
jgi:hypothetical protein